MTALISDAAMEAAQKEFNSAQGWNRTQPEKMRAALTAALPHLPASPDAGWRDIADAPKNGTLILIYGMATCFLNDGRSVEIQPRTWIAKWFGSGWFGEPNSQCVPFHWQPLPTPPRSAP